MWNKTDEPLAYFITFRTHGSWLHGDERGSVNRHHNRFRTSKIRHELIWLEKNKKRLIGEPINLQCKQRRFVKKAIKETCPNPGVQLLALNARPKHVHTVAAAPQKRPRLAC